MFWRSTLPDTGRRLARQTSDVDSEGSEKDQGKDGGGNQNEGSQDAPEAQSPSDRRDTGENVAGSVQRSLHGFILGQASYSIPNIGSIAWNLRFFPRT